MVDRGFKVISNVSAGNVECTETGTHRYPDALLWCKGFAIIVEIDEHAHRGEQYDCDWRRMAEICGSLSSAVWYLRYKPDAADSDLEALAQKVESIKGKELEDIEWEFFNFNVTYMFYNDKDLAVALQRKHETQVPVAGSLHEISESLEDLDIDGSAHGQ